MVRRAIPGDRIGELEQRVEIIEENGGGVYGGQIVGGELVGGINGINKNFSTSYDFIPNTTEIIWNGIRVKRGDGGDYVESGSNGLIFVEAPLPGDTLFINYWREVTA